MPQKKKRRVFFSYYVKSIILVIVTTGALVWLYYWYAHILYEGKIFRTVRINNMPVGGKTPEEIKAYWLSKNASFNTVVFTLTSDAITATISSNTLGLGYDATLSATQAYSIGRSGFFLSNIYQQLFSPVINLPPVFRWNEQVVVDTLKTIEETVNIPKENALFSFENGRVTAFKPSKPGREVNEKELLRLITETMPHVANGNLTKITIPIPITILTPEVTTDKANTFGIKEKIGQGYSEFQGSIPGRIHNVILAASKLNGVLIKPEETFSFNATVGDISAATGYQSAYIIKDGRTVLGDGGGVCQVSTTLFRAALNTGLPIIERHEHSYRVHYYEEGGFKAGIDATVYDPTNDLKFKNDTPGYILIQTSYDLTVPSLTFDLYGTSDGRKAEIYNHNVWGQTPPPPDLYQDDPTLQKGVVKQVDFAAWGAKASFQYKVTRNDETVHEDTFTSTYRPWQAVYLRGTKE